MLYVEFLIDDEPYELELHPGMVFTKCARCGQKIYGYFSMKQRCYAKHALPHRLIQRKSSLNT